MKKKLAQLEVGNEPPAEGRLGQVKVVFAQDSSGNNLLNISKDLLTIQSQSAFSTVKANCCVFKGKWMYEVGDRLFHSISNIFYVWGHCSIDSVSNNISIFNGVMYCPRRSSYAPKVSCKLAGALPNAPSHKTPVLAIHKTVTVSMAANSVSGT